MQFHARNGTKLSLSLSSVSQAGLFVWNHEITATGAEKPAPAKFTSELHEGKCWLCASTELKPPVLFVRFIY